MATLSDPQKAQVRALNANKNVNKADATNACWNWALHGLGGAHDPKHLFDFMARPIANDQPARTAAQQLRTAAQATLANWPWFQADQNRLVLLTTNRTSFDDAPTTQARINGCRNFVFKRAIEEAGFTLSDRATDYRIVMQCYTANEMSYSHWWLEVCNAANIETVAGEAQLHLRRGPSNYDDMIAAQGDEARNRLHAAYVTGIQDNQVARIADLLAA